MNAASATLTLARFHLRGATRSRWVTGGAAVFAAGSIAVAMAGLRSLSELGLAGAGAATDGLLHLALLLPPLIGLLIGAGSIARDRDRGLLAVLAAQPVDRRQLPVAAFLGSAAAVWAVVAFGFGAATVLIGAVADVRDLASLLAVGAISLAVAACAVALGVAISTLSRTHHQATATAAALWLLLALGLDLLLAGVAPGLGLGPGGLLAAVLVNPLEGGRVLAMLVMDHGAALDPFGAYLVDRLGTAGATAVLTGSLLCWTIAPLWFARRVIIRRDA